MEVEVYWRSSPLVYSSIPEKGCNRYSKWLKSSRRHGGNPRNPKLICLFKYDDDGGKGLLCTSNEEANARNPSCITYLPILITYLTIRCCEDENPSSFTFDDGERGSWACLINKKMVETKSCFLFSIIGEKMGCWEQKVKKMLETQRLLFKLKICLW